MTTLDTDFWALADWRRRVAESYTRVRHVSAQDPVSAHRRWVEERDDLFRNHASTPVAAEDLDRFTGLSFAPYRREWRVIGRIEPEPQPQATVVDLGRDGRTTLLQVGRVSFDCPGGPGVLSIFWVSGYGGGLFLPFMDRTNGVTSFGGGRYLYDTIKGADLGAGGVELLLDFNFAYNPSCAFDARWVCPLAPPPNALAFPVPVGELVPPDP